MGVRPPPPAPSLGTMISPGSTGPRHRRNSPGCRCESAARGIASRGRTAGPHGVVADRARKPTSRGNAERARPLLPDSDHTRSNALLCPKQLNGAQRSARILILRRTPPVVARGRSARRENRPHHARERSMLAAIEHGLGCRRLCSRIAADTATTHDCEITTPVQLVLDFSFEVALA